MPDTEVATNETRSLQPSCAVCGYTEDVLLSYSLFQTPGIYDDDGTPQYLCEDHRAYCVDCGYWEMLETGVRSSDWHLTGCADVRSTQRLVCGRCIDSYGECCNCGEILHRDDLMTHGEDTYCTQHYPDDSIDADDEEDDDNDVYSNSVIGDYHSSRHLIQHGVTSPWTRSNNRYIGVELEVEQIHGDRPETARAILANVNNAVTQITTDKHDSFRLLYAEHDGSLNNGFELVTAPLGLDDQRNLWARILTSSNIKGLRSHNTVTCGLHVHISRNKLTQLQIAKVVAFVNSSSNYAFMKRLARRYGTHYCKAKNIPLCNGAKNLDQDRYEMVNLCNPSTIEFRIFRGTLKLESLLACVEFANALVAYADCGSGTGMDITTTRFRRFIAEPTMRADTVYLRSYLASVVPATDTE